MPIYRATVEFSAFVYSDSENEKTVRREVLDRYAETMLIESEPPPSVRLDRVLEWESLSEITQNSIPFGQDAFDGKTISHVLREEAVARSESEKAARHAEFMKNQLNLPFDD